MNAYDKESLVRAAIIASEMGVSAQAVTTTIKLALAECENVKANHATPDGQDIKKMFAFWSDRSSVAAMLAAFNMTPKQLVQNVFHFKSTFKPQRAQTEYLALKAQTKAIALAVALLTGDALAFRAINKYLGTFFVLFEALNVSELPNGDVYGCYTGNKTRIESIVNQIDDMELRALLGNVELYKSESTATTQRPTSAWLFQLLRAGENNGNDRTVVVDKSSDYYKSMRDLFIGAIEA